MHCCHVRAKNYSMANMKMSYKVGAATKRRRAPYKQHRCAHEVVGGKLREWEGSHSEVAAAIPSWILKEVAVGTCRIWEQTLDQDVVSMRRYQDFVVQLRSCSRL